MYVYVVVLKGRHPCIEVHTSTKKVSYSNLDEWGFCPQTWSKSVLSQFLSFHSCSHPDHQSAGVLSAGEFWTNDESWIFQAFFALSLSSLPIGTTFVFPRFVVSFFIVWADFFFKCLTMALRLTNRRTIVMTTANTNGSVVDQHWGTHNYCEDS